VFENSVLRKLFGSKNDLKRNWRKLHIVDLLHSSLGELVWEDVDWIDMVQDWDR